MSIVLAACLLGCGGRASNVESGPRTLVDDSDRAKGGDAGIEPREPQSEPRIDADSGNVGIEFACGFRSASSAKHFAYRASGQNCGDDGGLNTFALRLTGSAAADYAAVVRCGYVRYDNGIFVGERVEVEARDGQWCDELALEQIDLADRMLLTDVSFALEARTATVPDRSLSLAIATRAGWTDPLPAAQNICIYVANRQTGAYACRLAPPADFCVCPDGDAWQDFFTDMKLSLEPQ